ncbi:MAG TPA: ABC transporter permease [Acidimicrobiales bacterium]
MRSLVLRRLAVLPVLLLGTTLLVFVLGRMAPGDPAELFAGGHQADPQAVERVREQWGLDDPLPVQYGHYLGRLLRGDLGRSTTQQADVTDVLRRRLPASLELTVGALLIGIPLGVGAGVAAARRRGSAVDDTTRLVAMAGASAPIFWVALVLGYLFSVRLGWLPLSGRLPPFTSVDEITGFYTVDALLDGDLGLFGAVLRHLALPALTLAIVPAAVMARFARSSFLDVLDENYIRTAHAYGIPPRRVVWRWAAKNAVLPLITLLSLLLPALIVGAVLIETVFSWPGVGTFLLEALQARDYAVVQSVTLLVAAIYALAGLAADVAHAALDPRTRRS